MLIAQITDSHIVAKGRHWLSEPLTKTSERLSKVVFHLNHMNPAPDVVLFTGDLCDIVLDELKGSYVHLQELLSPLKRPLFVIPGNHDHREELRSSFSKNAYMPRSGFIHYTIEDYPIRLIGLDTLVEGEHYGMLCNQRFDWLKNELKKEQQKPTLIFMHHTPAKTGTKLFDDINFRMRPDLEDLIRHQKNLLGILGGHYHHLCITNFGEKLCYLAPSIAPAHYFNHPLDDHITGIKLQEPTISLHQVIEGRLVSHVVRIAEQTPSIPWRSS